MIVAHFLASLAMAVLWLPVYLAGFPIIAVALLFASEKDEHLPRWLAWYDNPDGGINGDENGRNPIWPRVAGGRNRTYCWRWIWLAWRNPTAGFSHAVGVTIDRPVEHAEHQFGPIAVVINRMGVWWDYAFTIPYGQIGRGFYFRFGWKLSAWKQGKEIAQRMFRISPYKQL